MNKSNILYLSTDHLSPDSRKLTDTDLPDADFISIEPTEFGMDILIISQEIKEISDKVKKVLPSDMAKIVLFAADMDCNIIRLDSDEPPLEYLPRYGDGIMYDITVYIAFDIRKHNGEIVRGFTSRMSFNDCQKWPDISLLEAYYKTTRGYAEKELDAEKVINLRCISQEEYESMENDPQTEIKFDNSGTRIIRNGETLWKKETETK